MYIDFEVLKEYIIENNQNIYTILESLGCHKINEQRQEIRFALPNHENASSGRIKLSDLTCIVYTPDLELRGNIVNLIMKIENLEYYQALCYIIKILKININNVQKIQLSNKCTFGDEIISLYKKYKPIRVEDIDIPDVDINKYQYVFKPHYKLLHDEGIGMFVQQIFHIGYDLRSKRILFPHRYWEGPMNKFIGIVGRTTNEYYELLGIPKYCGVEPYPKSFNIYGLCENSVITKKNIKQKFPNIKGDIKTITDDKYLVIYEAEKSVLKRATVNDFTGVAICGHELSNKQLQILYSLNNVNEIIFALDKDVSLEFVTNMAKKIINKQVSIIYDKENQLGEKDSPADAKESIFQKLFRERIIVNR